MKDRNVCSVILPCADCKSAVRQNTILRYLAHPGTLGKLANASDRSQCAIVMRSECSLAVGRLASLVHSPQCCYGGRMAADAVGDSAKLTFYGR